MKALATTAASALLAAGMASAAMAQDAIRIVVVTHGQAADPFWSVIKNGLDEAAKDMGVTAEYRAPDTFDMVQMAQLIDAAVASRPDGLAVSIPDADALGDSISIGRRRRHPGRVLELGLGRLRGARGHRPRRAARSTSPVSPPASAWPRKG